MKKLLIGGVAVAVIAGLTADDIYLHVKVREMSDEIAALTTTVDRVEQWIETSSVQGHWNGYKRQIKDYKQRVADRVRSFKDAAKRKIVGDKDGAEAVGK